MTIRCTAVYEKGVLRPKETITLPEGAEVEVLVLENGPAASRRSIAERLAEIAALPIEGQGDPFISRDHDRILYGGEDPK